MKTSHLIFLLLGGVPLAVTAQTTPQGQPLSASGLPTVHGTQPPSFPEADWSWKAKSERLDEADTRSLRLNLYYGLTNVAIKKSFSAELVTDTKRLSRGNATRSRQSAMYYFDESGRRRHSYKTSGGEDRVMIIDPQQLVGYLIRPDHEDVLRMAGMPRKPISARTAPGTPAPPKFAKQVTTPLGTREFDGLAASGTLTESFYPAGTAGNDKDVVATHEAWSLPQLGITVYYRMDSPILGETVVQYKNIKVGEPPASVFEIPPDYKVRDVSAR